MPLYYDQVCGVLRGERNRQKGAFEEWDFDSWRPDAVVIHLGTNDEMAINTVGDCTVQDFEESVYRFLCNLRQRNPQSLLLWCYGMLGHGLEVPIRRAFRRFREETGDENNDILFFESAQDFGGRDHPGRTAHADAARALAQRLTLRLGL